MPFPKNQTLQRKTRPWVASRSFSTNSEYLLSGSVLQWLPGTYSLYIQLTSHAKPTAKQFTISFFLFFFSKHSHVIKTQAIALLAPDRVWPPPQNPVCSMRHKAIRCTSLSFQSCYCFTAAALAPDLPANPVLAHSAGLIAQTWRN